MSGSGQEAIPNVREWSEGPPGYSGVVQRPSRISGSGRKAIPNVRRPSRMFDRVFRPLPDIRERLPITPGNPRRPPGHPGGPSEHSRTSERASRTSMRVSRPLPDIREAFRTSRRASHHSRTSWRFCRTLADIREGLRQLPDFREGLLTTPGHPGGSPDHYRMSRSGLEVHPDVRVFMEGLHE